MSQIQKICIKCQEVKDLTDFSRDKRYLDGRINTCKACNNANNKQKYVENRDVLLERSKNYRIDNGDIVREKERENYSKNKEKVSIRNKKWAKENPEKVALIQLEYKKKNPESNLLSSRKYRENNKEKVQETGKKYRQKYYTDVNYRLSVLIRSRLLSAIKFTKKSEATFNLVGCTVDELRQHLESLFTEGMTWENQGEWHIDHKRPCASFDLSVPEQQKECFHYTNLQPLWAVDNIKKGSNYNDQKHKYE